MERKQSEKWSVTYKMLSSIFYFVHFSPLFVFKIIKWKSLLSKPLQTSPSTVLVKKIIGSSKFDCLGKVVLIYSNDFFSFMN